MNVVMMGPPGSGKGTQGVRLAAALGCDHISTGALLRAEMAAGTDVGARVAATVASGALVSDELMSELAIPRIEEAAAARGGYVLDGFPRSTVQARRLLGCAAPPALVIVLDVAEHVLGERIRQRAATEGRSDDTAEVLAERLRVYAEETRPVIDVFARAGRVRFVDAATAPDTVAGRILDTVLTAG